MWDELLRLPHQWLGWPLFGIGWALAAWLMGGAAVVAWAWRRRGLDEEVRGLLHVFIVGVIAIVFLMPRLEVEGTLEKDPGLPLRGYGLMVTLGVIAGVMLAVRQARRNGVDPDDVFGLAFWCFVAGIVGSRGFYVIQYHEQYFHGSLRESLVRIVNFTEGGLVVYGSFLGAVPACYYYLRSKRLPVRAMADLVAPSFMVGLAIGRIGCFLHGCCFAGLCPQDGWTVRFPHDTPPYQHQQARGQLHGLTLGTDDGDGSVVVRAIDPTGPAAASGLRVGDVVRQLNGRPVPPLDIDAFRSSDLIFDTQDGRTISVSIPALPARSGPTRPVQLYSAVHAAALALLLWAWYPFRRRDGEVFTLLITLYPMGRILEEIIRDDEPGRLHTALTISQWVSLGLLATALVFWWRLLRQPAGTAWPRVERSVGTTASVVPPTV